MYDYYQIIENDLELRKELELCESKIDYFSTLFGYVAKLRTKRASVEYVFGYSEVELRYIDMLKSGKYDMFALLAKAKQDINTQDRNRIANENEYQDDYKKGVSRANRHWFYIRGSMDALHDVDYCVTEVMRRFATSTR